MVKMVDITEKEGVLRIAEAEGGIKLKKETIQRIKESKVEKGDVKTISKIAAIEAVKKVPNLLPLCHPIPLTGIDVTITTENKKVRVHVRVKSVGKTGCEMEALTGVTVALLNVWDMIKRYEKDEEGQYPWTRIEGVKVTKKVKKKLTHERKQS